MIYENILQTIGNTPLVRINRLHSGRRVSILAKIEGVNPSGSIKDRIAFKMIEQAEAGGFLTKGKTIIEPTSGNTGIGLSMIGVVKGYKVEIVMSRAVSSERIRMIKAFGAKVTLTDAKLGTDGAIIKARELIRLNPGKYFMPDQFSNNYNKLAHYKTTGEEIWKQTNGKIDYFVSAIGTSGTIMGVGKALKENNPAIYDPSKIDEVIMVETGTAYAMARQVVRKEGIFVGMSSGAAMHAALDVAKRIRSGNIVVIFPDRGEKYLSTCLFS
jgi:cysteine synthase B